MTQEILKLAGYAKKIESLIAERDELAHEIQKLQKALAFWLPNVPSKDSKFAERCANDAYLLAGCEGEIEPSAQKLGWIKTQPEQEPVADAYALADKVREALDRKACPDAFMRIAYESIIKNYITPPQRTEQEPVAWRFTGIAGLKRYMTQKQYDAQTPETKKWYEPFRCAKCITPPQSTEICCQQYDTCLRPCTPRGEHLAQRTWVGLDHHDKKKFSSWLDHKTDDEIFTAIEAKLKQKNGYAEEKNS